jgi:hypothetical protein
VIAVFPNYMVSRDWEDCGSRPAQAKKFGRPHLKREKAESGGVFLSSQ